MRKRICNGDKQNEEMRPVPARSKIDAEQKKELHSKSSLTSMFAIRTKNSAPTRLSQPAIVKPLRSIPAKEELHSAQEKRVMKSTMTLPTILKTPAGSRIPTISKVYHQSCSLVQSKSDVAQHKSANHKHGIKSSENRSNVSASIKNGISTSKQSNTTHTIQQEQPIKKILKNSGVFDRLYQNNAQRVARLEKLRQDYLKEEKKAVTIKSSTTPSKNMTAKESVNLSVPKKQSIQKQKAMEQSIKPDMTKKMSSSTHCDLGLSDVQKQQNAKREQSSEMKRKVIKTSQTRPKCAASNSVYERLSEQKTSLSSRQQRDEKESQKSIAPPKTNPNQVNRKNDTKIPVWERLHASSRRLHNQNQQKSIPSATLSKEVGTTATMCLSHSRRKATCKQKRDTVTLQVVRPGLSNGITGAESNARSYMQVPPNNIAENVEALGRKLLESRLNSLDEIGDDQKTETSDSNADEPHTLDIRAYHEEIQSAVKSEMEKTSDPLLLRSKSILAEYGAWAAELELKMQHMTTISKVVY
uniref:AlNc14C257G9740 protein n=1 Tax=Albugo laibachii Nc14 TaxID=890382 RepID=F0WTR5_9STRA|nr:AlNc14C257G9740 [Albugo laibachii Nc14]|eukprot:CCA24758.1 AlNc14C257G9740 [Albugo laibachii Nc14]